jgi:hypothetical protein
MRSRLMLAKKDCMSVLKAKKKAQQNFPYIEQQLPSKFKSLKKSFGHSMEEVFTNIATFGIRNSKKFLDGYY